MGQCHEMFDFWFFSGISFPKHLSIPLRPFRIFLKIRGDLRQFATGCNFAASIVDTGGKFAAGVNNTSGTGGK
jgi:hypothetical protein